jgi:hypothetical protein
MRPSRASTPFHPGRDEVDEQREVVDAGVALGEQVALERRKPAEQLVHQTADLGEVAADRLRFAANRVGDAVGQ